MLTCNKEFSVFSSPLGRAHKFAVVNNIMTFGKLRNVHKMIAVLFTPTFSLRH